MKPGHKFFLAGLLISVLIHAVLFCLFSVMDSATVTRQSAKQSILVPVNITIPEKPQQKQERKKTIPKPIPPKKKVVRKVAKKTVPNPVSKPNPVPVSHKRSTKRPPAKAEEVKPVFGISKKTTAKTDTGTLAVRVGNTLMKEQETEYTPPEKVKDYITVPVFELTTMPEFKRRVTPEYPTPLKNKEQEGEVALSVTIDNTGKVTDVRILRASHMLFAEASVEAVKKSLFKPATQNGSAVGTVLDDLVYTFILDTQ